MQTGKHAYSIIVPDETITRAGEYLEALRTGRTRPGALLQERLEGSELAEMRPLELLGRLFDTKRPRIFAESEVAGDGSDWNLIELSLLGDISVAAPVTIYDDGSHHTPRPHHRPFQGMLIFTSGALLRSGRNQPPADWEEAACPDGRFSPDGYHRLYLRRLLPVLRFLNGHAARPGRAFLTVPGLGCGQFAGRFQGQLGAHLQHVLEELLSTFGADFPNLKALYFDPYNECEQVRKEIHGISFMVRPMRAAGSSGKPQLCPPADYAEEGDDFSGCSLYSIVAWDHVSWPGNDFYAGARATDDGVKAAATNSMAVFTGVEGNYDPTAGEYQPPAPCKDWQEVVKEGMRMRQLRLWNPLAVWRPADHSPK